MTRDRRDIREKTRAVLLAAIMIVSVFGGTMAFAGNAAAGPTSANLSDELVEATDVDVTINGTQDGGDTVFVATDRDGDGQFDGSNDTSHALSGSFSEAGSYEATFTPGDLSLEDGDSVDIYAYAGEPSDGDSLEESAGTLTVDTSGPNIETGEATPSNEVVDDPRQEIVVPVRDATTEVESIEVELYSGDETSSENLMGAFELTPDSEPEGLSYENENLTVSPGNGNIPVLQDGETTVYITATDTAGNTNEDASFSFDVETGSLEAEFDDTQGSNNAEETFIEGSDQNPFDVSDKLAVYDENEYGVDFGVSLTPPTASEINDSTAELTIDGPGADGEVTFDNEGPYTDGTFTINDGDTEDYNFSADGVYTVTVSGADTAGNQIEESFAVKVDTTAPTAQSLTVPEQITREDLDSAQEVTVSFDEPVDPSTVTVDLRVGGNSEGTVSSSGDGEYTETVSAEFTPKSEGLEGFENGSAVARVTAGDDVATNSLTEDGQNETNFSVYTETPEVGLSVPTPSEGSDFGGGVNATTFVDNTDDDVDATYLLWAVDESGDPAPSPVDITDDAENVNTSTYPDGKYVLEVVVTDEYGNTNNDISNPFTLNNGQDLTVDQQYLAGALEGSSSYVGTNGIDSISNLFENTPDETTYTIGDSDADSSDSIPAEDNRGDTVNVTASGGGETRTVTLEFPPLVGAESVEGDEINIGVASPTDDLEELNVTVRNTDDYFEDEQKTLTIEDFDEPELVESGGDYVYSDDVPGLRDGQYEVVVTDAEDDGGDVDDVNFNDASTVGEIEVDDSKPSVTAANLVGGNEGHTDIRVRFSEPLDSLGAVDDFKGESVKYDENPTDGDGVVNVTVQGQVSIDDETELSFDSITEEFHTDDGDDDTPYTRDNGTDVTFAIDLSEGLSVVSIPAETGRVDFSETEFNSDAIETVSAYDADTGEWLQYSPGADDNELTTLEGGVGYTVTAEEDTTVELNVENAPAPNDRTQQSVEAGWNLVGHYQEDKQQVGQALSPLGDQVYQIEEGYTGTQLTNDAALNPEQGYWLFTNEGGLHVPVNYGGPTSEKPDVFVPSGVDFVDSEPTNGGSVKLTVAVDTDAAVQTVRVDSPELDIEGAELSTRNADVSVQGATAYAGSVDLDYQADYDGIDDATVTVSAITTDGNVGSNSVDVDPADRSGSVSIDSADVSNTNTDDESIVQVTTTYDDGGFVSPELVIENSSGTEVGSLADPATDGSNKVPVQLSKLDNDEQITAKLIDADEDEQAVPNSTDPSQLANDTAQVEGLTQLAYIENSPSTILGTGASAIQDAENDAASDGETIYVEQGTYDPVSIDKSVTVIGSGNETAESGGTVISGSTGSAGGAVDVQSGTSDVTVKSVRATDNGESASAAFMVRSDVTNLEVSDSTLVGESKSALLMEGGQTDHTVQDNTIEVVSDGETAVTLAYVNGDQSVGKTSTGVDFVDNTFTGDLAGGVGLGVESESSEIRQNTFSVESSYGQLEVWATGSTVDENTFETVSSGSFYFNDGDGNYGEDTIVSDNTFPDSAEINGDQIVEPSEAS